MIHCINKIEDLKLCYYTTDVEKCIWQNSTLIYDSKLSTKWVERKYAYHNKEYVWQAHDDLILNSEKLKVFLLRSGTRQEWLLSPILFNIVLEVPAKAISRKK